jgi:hypothetical protein
MIINQPSSIGDILFIEPICRHIWKTTGVKPILPVRDHLIWIVDYIDSADFRLMSQFKMEYDSMSVDDKEILPLRFANQIMRGFAPDDHHDFENMMLDKYRLACLDLILWKTLSINFNSVKSDKLFEYLNLKRSDNYILVNENSQAGKVNINPDTDFRIIKMSEILGFTVLDWCEVILNAKENHHVSTCTFYIMQALCNIAVFKTKVFLYKRPNEDGLRGISKLNQTFGYESR